MKQGMEESGKIDDIKDETRMEWMKMDEQCTEMGG